jgi:DNA-binding NarL/FixJ family response regulator
MTQPIRILIADDHPPTRADVRAALEQDERFTICAERADAAAAVQGAVHTQPDICLLDIRMSGSGISAAREITSRLPDTKVVMLTVSRDEDDLFNALRAGASGYLLKDTDPQRLPHALHAVVEGETAIPRWLVTRLVSEFRDHGPRRRAIVSEAGYDLTSREWEVLDLLKRGLTTAEIAERLFVSSVTVRSHVAAILKKLRVPDREALRKLDES